jgi:HKD family nuclease
MNKAKKLHALLEVNRVTSEILKDLLPKLKELKGQKILKADGSILAKYAELLKIKPVQVKGFENDYANFHRGYLSFSGYSVWLVIDCQFKYDQHSCFYESTNTYVGTLFSNAYEFLEEVEEFPEELNKVTTLQEQEELLKQYGELKKQMKLIESQIILKDELRYV